MLTTDGQGIGWGISQKVRRMSNWKTRKGAVADKALARGVILQEPATKTNSAGKTFLVFKSHD
jgi:hypothetical protein